MRPTAPDRLKKNSTNRSQTFSRTPAGTKIRGNHVFHHVEVSVFTNLVGTTLERAFTLAGDTLTIRTLPPEIWGTSNRLVWKRTA